MPQFFLHVFNDKIALDDHGIERVSLDDAKIEAVKRARALIAQSIVDARPVYFTHRVEIGDDGGNILHVVRFGDMVELRR